MPNQSVEKINIISIKDGQGRITGFIVKEGIQVQFYTASLAGFEDIEELLKSIIQ